MSTVHRNDSCPCGSGRKYKKCCMAADEKRERTLRLVGADEGAPRRRGDLRDLHIGTVWQMDLAPVPSRFDDDPSARPVMLMVLAGDVVLHGDIVAHPPSEYDDIAALLESAIDAAIEASHVSPTIVELRFKEIAAPLATRLQSRSISVRVAGSLPKLAAALDSFERRVLGKKPASDRTAGIRASSAGTWRGWGLTDDRTARIFSAAAGYYRAAPWRYFTNDQVLRCQRPDGEGWDCVVLGAAGIELGIGMYSRREDILDLLTATSPGNARPRRPQAVLSLTFGGAELLGRAAAREIRSAGWEVAEANAFPFLMAIETPAGGITSDRFEDIEAALLAIPRFVESHRAALAGDEVVRFPLRWTDPESGTIVSYDGSDYEDDLGESLWGIPSDIGPALPKGSGADPTATITDDSTRVIGEYNAETIQRFIADEMKIVARFGEQLSSDTGGKTLSRTTVSRHIKNAELFIDFLGNYQGYPLRAVTEYDLRVFLYDWYPRKVRSSKTGARSLLVSLARFFEYLAEFENIEYPWALPILRDVDVFMERWESFPGGPWWDADTDDWQSDLHANLSARALLCEMGGNGDDEVDWGGGAGGMGMVELELAQALQRQWLLWREEEVLRGTTDPELARAAIIPRQREWEQTPNALVDGLTPAEAVARERAERAKPSR